MTIQPEKEKELAKLAREYAEARKLYEQKVKALKEQGITSITQIQDQLEPAPSKLEKMTFEEFAKRDPDLYQLTTNSAIFAKGKSRAACRSAFKLYKSDDNYWWTEFGGIEKDGTYNNDKWRHYEGSLSWYQEKIELAKQWYEMIKDEE